jgi:ABC-type multidrug transport system ATPase subunit
MEQLDMVGLADRARSKVKTYSQGMKQRLGLACALIHQPRLIILDEPVNGLDPQGITDMRSMIIHLSKGLGKTLFVSSHQLSEMEMVADNMLIIHKGRKIVEGNVSELLHPEEPFVELVAENREAAVKFIRESEWYPCFQGSSDNRIKLKLAKNKIPEFNRQLVNQGISVQSLRPVHSLEEYFLSQTKE